jgi:hypothetical protein
MKYTIMDNRSGERLEEGVKEKNVKEALEVWEDLFGADVALVAVPEGPTTMVVI